MRAKIENGVVVKDNYTFADLKVDNHGVSFPREMPDERWVDYGVVVVTPTLPPVYNPLTHTVTQGVSELVNGEWVQTWVLTAKTLADAKEHIKDALEAEHRSHSEGSVTINGIRLGTDARALALLVGAKQGAKPTRKFATRNGRAELTKVQFDALVTGVDDFLQACQDRYYDLFGLIEAAQDVPSLSLIDLAAGWP